MLCILNNVFQYSKIRTRKRNAKKSIKTEKNLESSHFWNPESAIQYLESGIHRVESRIQYCYGFPYMGRKGQIQRCQHTMTVKKFIKNVRRKSASTSNYYKRLLFPNSSSKTRWHIGRFKAAPYKSSKLMLAKMPLRSVPRVDIGAFFRFMMKQ